MCKWNSLLWWCALPSTFRSCFISHWWSRTWFKFLVDHWILCCRFASPRHSQTSRCNPGRHHSTNKSDCSCSCSKEKREPPTSLLDTCNANKRKQQPDLTKSGSCYRSRFKFIYIQEVVQLSTTTALRDKRTMTTLDVVIRFSSPSRLLTVP